MSTMRNGISWAGLAFGAAAVAFNTQVGYSLVSANCGEATRIVVFTAMISSGVGSGWRLAFGSGVVCAKRPRHRRNTRARRSAWNDCRRQHARGTAYSRLSSCCKARPV